MHEEEDDREEQHAHNDRNDEAEDGEDDGTDVLDGCDDGVAQARGGRGGGHACEDGGRLDRGGGAAAGDEGRGPLEHGVDRMGVEAELRGGDEGAGDGGGGGGEGVEGVVEPGDVVREGFGDGGEGEGEERGPCPEPREPGAYFDEPELGCEAERKERDEDAQPARGRETQAQTDSKEQGDHVEESLGKGTPPFWEMVSADLT